VRDGRRNKRVVVTGEAGRKSGGKKMTGVPWNLCAAPALPGMYLKLEMRRPEDRRKKGKRVGGIRDSG
jgi:hypothetical protein